MAATKYMPYFFGLHALFCYAAHPHPGMNRPDKKGFYAAMALAFIVANFAMLQPDNWTYISRYASEQLREHTGYVFDGRLYMNLVSASPWGVPSRFYVEYILTKTPVLLIVAIAAGLGATALHARERGFVFLRVFVIFILLPYSLAASKFVRYVLPLLAVLDMMAAVGLVRLSRFIRHARWPRPVLRHALAASLSAIVMAGSLVATLRAAPYYGLYRNRLAHVVAGDGLIFPHCELYDAGMREAARLVASRATPGAVVLSEAPRVVRHYSERPDLVSRSVARDGFPARGDEVWVLVQDGRLYFENLATIVQLRASHSAEAEIRVGNVTAVQVYHLRGVRSTLQARQ